MEREGGERGKERGKERMKTEEGGGQSLSYKKNSCTIINS